MAPIGADGHLGIAEGIETALSAQAIFGVPTWAALSADGLRRWQWPAGVSRVTIFADAGDAGMQAAATLADRLNVAGIANAIVSPLHGDDFNDDLRRGATAADYQRPMDERSPAPAVLRTVAEFDAAAQALTNPPDLQALGRILGPARPGPAGAAARAPGADARSRAPPASPSPSWKSRSANCAAG